MATATITAGHEVSVSTVVGRYPFKPACSCGEPFFGYLTQDAAEVVAEGHRKEALGLRTYSAKLI